MDLQSVWIKMFPMLQIFNNEQRETIKSALFATLGNCEISEINQSTDIVLSEDKNKKAVSMFFIAKKVEGLSDKTLRYYQDTIKKIFSVVNKPIDLMTTDDIRYYLAIRQIQDKVSMTTIDNERRIISSFFDWLSTEDYVAKNIVKPIKKIRYKKKKKRAFTPVELSKIKDACSTFETEEKRKRAIALIEVLLSTGCRVGEMSTLTIDNIDLDRGTAIVLGKGNKERVVYLNEVAKLRLREYWECRKKQSKYCFCALPQGSKSINQGQMNVSGIEILVRELGKIAKVSECHPHKFRRTMASEAIKRGMSVMDVQRILGHESLETTKIYLDLDDSNLQFQHQKFL